VSETKPGRVRSHLETTQSEAFDEALRFVDANDAIVDALRTHPESLVDGVFAFSEGKGLLARLFGGRRPSPEDIAPVSKPARVRTEEEERRLAENRRIVEEALRAR
jgi:hypothetical protein